MKINRQFGVSDFKKVLDQVAHNLELATIEQMHRIGLQFIIDARNHGDYEDQSSNLRHSVGYIILKNGVNIEQDFESGATDGKGAEGIEAGISLANKVAKEYQSFRGLVLIGVAGMSYAAAVESKGRDVISGSYLIVQKSWQNTRKRLMNKAASLVMNRSIQAINHKK